MFRKFYVGSMHFVDAIFRYLSTVVRTDMLMFVFIYVLCYMRLFALCYWREAYSTLSFCDSVLCSEVKS